ncbi:40530_t:CDS:2, partial [Gigaspora margarita]
MASSTKNGTPGLNSQKQEPRQTDDDSSKESAQVELMASRKKAKFTENGTPGLNSQRQEPRQTDDDSSKESTQVELMVSRKKVKLKRLRVQKMAPRTKFAKARTDDDSSKEAHKSNSWHPEK